MGKFIGIDNLTHVAEKLQPNIIMGPAYYNRDDLKRFGIKVITGVQFKDTAMILNRKGATSRRKVVNQPLDSNLGYLTERTLVAHIVWNKFTHNEDEFQETPIQIQGSAAFHYPQAEEIINQIGIEFNDDVYPNIWGGDEESEKPELAFFNGYHALIAQDIAEGNISIAAGNLIEMNALAAPAEEGDTAAWDEFVAWYDKWHPGLKRQNVRVIMSLEYGHYIADAYEQKHRSHSQAILNDDGTFKVREYPKLTFVPSDDFGRGTRIVATVDGNLEFGVNNESDGSFIGILKGDKDDLKNITFQVQGIYGCRILRVNAANFVTNGGSIENSYFSGDYQKDSFIAVPNDASLGTVSVSPAPVNGEYAEGTTLTLTATPGNGAKFVKWSGATTATDAQTSVVTKGQPEAAVAIFAEIIKALADEVEVLTTDTNVDIAKYFKAASDATVAFASGTTATATINSSTGVLTPVAAGETTITATATLGGNTYTATLKVKVVEA